MAALRRLRAALVTDIYKTPVSGYAVGFPNFSEANLDLLKDALRYARMGFHVFPLQPGTKIPFRGSNGFENATINEKKIVAWWMHTPEANIGFWPAGSDLVAIDLDPGHEEIDLPPTLTVKTPRGWHRYYHSTERFGNRQLAPHIDVRSAYGYTVLPPSTLANGKSYKWIDEYAWIDELPAWVSEQLSKKQERQIRGDWEIDTLDRIERLHTLARIWKPAEEFNGSDIYTIEIANRALDLCSIEVVIQVLMEDWVPRCEGNFTETWITNKVCNAAKSRTSDIGCDPWQNPSNNYPKPKVRKSSKIILKNGKHSQMQEISWLWPGWLARGKFHILAGQGGAGKSTLCFDLMAKISTGDLWPDGTKAPLGDVLVWSGEDNFEDTILPRFVAAGGDRKRLYCVGGVIEDEETRAFDPSIDIGYLLDAASAIPDLQLVLIDPIVNAIGAGRDSHKNAEVRRGLQPVVDFAEARGIALIGITHYTKGTEGRDPTERVTGSLAFAALARIVLGASADENGDKRRVVRAKSNIGPTGGGFEYRLGQGLAEDLTAQTVIWGSQLAGSARDLLGNGKQKALERAEAFLMEFLAGGPVSKREIDEAANAHIISQATLDRAKEALGIKPYKGRDGRWVWGLPDWTAPLT